MVIVHSIVTFNIKCVGKFMGGKLILLQLVLYITLLQVLVCVSSPNSIQVIKSRRMSWVGHVACMGKRQGTYRLLVGNPREEMGMDGRLDLYDIERGHGLDWCGSGIGQVAGFCECCSELLGTIK